MTTLDSHSQKTAGEKTQSRKRVGANRWTVIVGALVVQIILGTVYAFSVFVRPLEQEFGWSRATTQWAFSFALASFAICMIPAGRLQDKVGPRKVAAIGGLLLGLSFILGALLVNESRPWALYLTYGIVGGAGIGFAYVCPIAAAVKWFPDKKGLITGLAVAGFGAGALFFAGPAATLLLPPGEGSEALGLSQILLVALGITEGSGFGIGWQAFFVLHGIVAAAAVLLGAMLLQNPPAGWTPAGWTGAQTQTRPQVDLEWQAMLNTPLACMLWLTFIFGATSGLMAIGQWTPLMGSILGGQTFAPTWLGTFGRFVEPVGILAIFNALGRIFWGRVSDIIDRPRAMMMMFLLRAWPSCSWSASNHTGRYSRFSLGRAQLWRQLRPLPLSHSRLLRHPEPGHQLRLDLHRLWRSRHLGASCWRRPLRCDPTICAGLPLCRRTLLYRCRERRRCLGPGPRAAHFG